MSIPIKRNYVDSTLLDEEEMSDPIVVPRPKQHPITSEQRLIAIATVCLETVQGSVGGAPPVTDTTLSLALARITMLVADIQQDARLK